VTATTALDTAADTVVDLSLRGCTTREPTDRELFDVPVGMYSIVVFATLARTVGASFLERGRESRDLFQ
jgi:hypothetical protein